MRLLPLGRTLLHFGAVDWQILPCIGMVPSSVNTSEAICDAFSVDVSSGAKATSNELVLAVYDPSDKGYQGEWCTVLPEYSFLIYY